jgi:hypothetical protein
MAASRFLHPRLVTLLPTLLALFMLGACSPVGSQANVPPSHPTTQPIIIPTATATLGPPSCGSQFGAAFQATLPDATSTVTSVYADVLLPPETRSYGDDRSYGGDATGLRVRFNRAANELCRDHPEARFAYGENSGFRHDFREPS